MDRIDVVAAAIIDGSKVFVGQKAKGPLQGLWEFPGGKVERGEAPVDALRREIAEELGCAIEVIERIHSIDHDYDFIKIRLHTFWCQLESSLPIVLEHAAGIWADEEQLAMLKWAPADQPAVSIVRARLQTLTGSTS